MFQGPYATTRRFPALVLVAAFKLLLPAAAQALPDLITQNLSLSPSSGPVGSSFTVSFTVKNQGTGTALASTANVRMATSSSTVTTSDPLLFSVSVPSLGAGSTFNVSKSVNVPSGRPTGSNYVWVIEDVNSSAGQGSANEANDKSNKLFTVTASLPDLITQNLSLSPSSGPVGSSFIVSFTVKNQGTGTAQASTANVRMATSSSTVTTSDPLLFSVSVPSLSAGSTFNVSKSVNVPSGRPTGSNYVWVIEDVNSTAGQGAANEANDKSNKLFTVTASLPDLITQNLSLSPSSGPVGSSFTVSFTVKNQGIGTAQASTANVRMATSSSTVTTSDPLLFSVSVPSLSAGSTFNVSQSVNVPSGRPTGSNYVWVIEDVNSTAGQGSANEANDKSNKLFTVTTSGLPDLITQNLAVNPASGAVGSSFTVSFTVKNQGTAQAQASTANVRMATSSSTVTTSDPLLFSVNVPSLAVGGTFNVSQSVTVPSGRPTGSNYVWVIEDVNSSAGQGAANEANDKTNTLFTVTTSGLPDLITQNLAVSPASGAVGSSFTVSFTVKNQGTAQAQASTANVRMATSSSTVTTSDPLLFSVNVPSLSVGGTFNVSQSVTVPSGRPTGSNYVWVIEDVNSSAGQGTANEANDRTNTLFTVTASGGLPDLVPQSISANPSSLEPGATTTVTFTVRNKGTGSAAATTTRLRLSASAAGPSLSDPILADVSAPALAAGASSVASVPVTIPSGTAPGNRYVWVIVDNFSKLQQSDAGNDFGSTPVSVLDPGAPPETLPSYFEFSSIPTSQQLGVGFSITLKARSASGALVAYTGSVSLSSSIGSVGPSSLGLNSGVGTATVKIDTAGRGVRLHASGAGATGTSNAFDVTTASPAVGRLSGRVTLQSTGAVIAGATVTLTGAQGPSTSTTGQDGRFAFSNVASGQYTVMATQSSTGYHSTTLSLQIVANATRWQPIVLSDCNPAGVTPVLLVPGILGSSLPEGFFGPHLPADSPSWNDSRWAPWGEDNPGGLFEFYHWPGWVAFVEALQAVNSRYKVGCTVFPVPYDWRKPVATISKEYLELAIAHAKVVAGTSEVDIVAHSMGGLVARSYIQGPSYQNDVKRLAMVGTPNNGAPFAYYFWQGADPKNPTVDRSFYNTAIEDVSQTLERRSLQVCQSSGTAGSTPAACGLDRQRVFDLLHEHVRSVRDLLPSDSQALSPNGALSCTPLAEWTNELLAKLNSPSSLAPLIGMTTLYAGKTKTNITPGTLAVESRDCSQSFYPDGVPKANQTMGFGDGTVPLASVSLPGLSAPATQDAEHAALIYAHRAALTTLMSSGEPGTNLAGLSMLQEAAVTPPARELSVSVLGRPQLQLRAPDQSTSGVTPGSGVETNGIPGSLIYLRPDATSVKVQEPADGTYQISLSGVHDEDYRLRIVYSDDAGNAHQIEGVGFFSGTSSLTFDLDVNGTPTLQMNDMPPAPTGLVASLVTATSKTQLSWAPSPDPLVVEYNVYSRPANMPNLSLLGSTAQTSMDTQDSWSGDVYAVSALYADGSESFLSEQVENDDRDHDGLTDAREAALGTGVDDPDSDQDGLSDGAEVSRGTNPLDADSDHDGFSDADEIARGSDPLDANSSPALSFYTIAPCRLVDTRSGSALVSGIDRSFALAGSCGIPATARALSVNVTVVGATGQGYVSLLPVKAASVNTSVINFNAGQVRSNNGMLLLAPDGSGSAVARAAVAGGGGVHLILDATGYFAEDDPLAGKWRGTVAGYAADLLIAENGTGLTALLSIDQGNDPLEELNVLSATATGLALYRPADDADLQLSLVQRGTDQCLEGEYLEPGSSRPVSLCRTSETAGLADDFEATDFSPYRFVKFGTNLDGVSWTFVQDNGGSVLQGSGGNANGGGDSVAYLARLDPELNDASISVRLKVQEVRNGGHHSGIAARFKPTTLEFYELWVNTASDLLILSRRTGPQEVRLASRPLPASLLDGWITLEFEVTRSTLRGLVNGEALIEIEDGAFDVGGIGFSNAGGVTRFDELRIAPPGM